MLIFYDQVAWRTNMARIPSTMGAENQLAHGLCYMLCKDLRVISSHYANVANLAKQICAEHNAEEQR